MNRTIRRCEPTVHLERSRQQSRVRLKSVLRAHDVCAILVLAVSVATVGPIDIAVGMQPAAPRLADKVKFKRGDGKPAFSFKMKADGAKLVDGDEHELARFTWSDGKLKIKDPSDHVLGYVIVQDSKLFLETPDQATRLFSLALQSDGDWKFEDSSGTRLATLKRRDYGYEVEDAAGASRFKAKLHNAKTSLRDANDHTILYTDDTITAAAVACLGLERITDQRLQCALALALARHEHP